MAATKAKATRKKKTEVKGIALDTAAPEKKTELTGRTFREFVEEHKKLHPGIDYDTPDTVGFVDLMRLYNSEAILRPENCSQVVLHEGNRVYRLAPNCFQTGKEQG